MPTKGVSRTRAQGPQLHRCTGRPYTRTQAHPHGGPQTCRGQVQKQVTVPAGLLRERGGESRGRNPGGLPVGGVLGWGRNRDGGGYRASSEEGSPPPERTSSRCAGHSHSGAHPPVLCLGAPGRGRGEGGGPVRNAAASPLPGVPPGGQRCGPLSPPPCPEGKNALPFPSWPTGTAVTQTQRAGRARGYKTGKRRHGTTPHIHLQEAGQTDRQTEGQQLRLRAGLGGSACPPRWGAESSHCRQQPPRPGGLEATAAPPCSRFKS